MLPSPSGGATLTVVPRLLGDGTLAQGIAVQFSRDSGAMQPGTPFAGKLAPRDDSMTAKHLTSILVASLAAAAAGSAQANPVMSVDEAYAQQVPGSAHVQLTRLVYPGDASAMVVTRDGQTLSAEVVATAGPSRDLGSGVTSIPAFVMCDCSVPKGQHRYVVDGFTVNLEVLDAIGTSLSPPPQPSADCVTSCPSAPIEPGAGGATGQGGSTAAGGATATPTEKDDSSGCSISLRSGGSWLGALGLLSALALVFGRRRT